MSYQDDDRSHRLDNLVKRFQEQQNPFSHSEDAPSEHLSPIRPSDPDAGNNTPPKQPILPQPETPAGPDPLTPREQMQQAEEALIRLREKMAALAAEFAAGSINRAQFDAIYARYSEQRDITERLLTRDPSSQAWQSVVRPGHTTFLKQRYAAEPLAYALYEQANGALLASHGPLKLSDAQVVTVLARLAHVRRQHTDPGPAQRVLADGRCLVFAPGELTLGVVLFSLEPAAAQLTQIIDMHHDFERANQHALAAPEINVERLVFPYRALFA